ncbi:MAG: hypothetical protein Q4G22_00175 [Paracoccus sp. (in: a-proteobacteria)]|nr:hypothetical protein [Paracoccus sp. (in: a-proteobacteria)]
MSGQPDLLHRAQVSAKQASGEFLSSRNLAADRIEFIDMILDSLNEKPQPPEWPVKRGQDHGRPRPFI